MDGKIKTLFQIITLVGSASAYVYVMVKCSRKIGEEIRTGEDVPFTDEERKSMYLAYAWIALGIIANTKLTITRKP